MKIECSQCHKKEQVFMVMNNTIIVCTKCGRNSILCDECKKFTKNTKQLIVDMEYHVNACKKCINRYYKCSKCGTYHLENQECQDIWKYNLKPIIKFIGQGNRYFGIELEISHKDDIYNSQHGNSGERKQLAEKVIAIFGHNFYIKHDGSVQNGLEVVSHPMTKNNIFTNFDRYKFTQLKDLGFIDHESCGLHMHVSKNSISTLTLYKLFKFIKKHSNKIFKLTKRNILYVNRYCLPIQKEKEIIYFSHNKLETNKHVGLRITKQTIEFRILPGTINYDIFCGYIELYLFILDYVTVTSMKEIDNFKLFVQKLHKSNYKYLKKMKGFDGVYYNSQTQKSKSSICLS